MSGIHSVLIEAVAYEWTPDEVDASRKPPYSNPAPIHSHVEAILAEIDAHLPAEGDGQLVVLRALSAAQSYSSAARGVARGRIVLLDAACLLLSARAISIAEAQAICEHQEPRAAAGLRRQIVVSHLDDGDVESAIAATVACGENAYGAMRDIGRWYSRRGDSEGYLRLASKYGGGKDRAGLDEMRAALVRQVSLDQGWEAALALTEDKRIGTAQRINALLPLAKEGRFDELVALFAARPELLDQFDQLRVIGSAILAFRGDSQHPALASHIERVAAIDPSVDKKTMRLRDRLLFMLLPGIRTEESFSRLHAAVRTPLLKRDVKSDWTAFSRRSAPS